MSAPSPRRKNGVHCVDNSAQTSGGYSCGGKGEKYIYDASFYFMFDEFFQEGEPLIIPMEEGRDTPEYRQAAIAWFKLHYDLDIPPDAQHNDILFKDDAHPNGQAIMQVWRTNPLYRMNVTGVDVQGHPRWQGKLPINNAFMKDDGYMIIVTDPDGLVVHGLFGDMEDPVNGYRVPAGSFILYGYYRLFTETRSGKEKFQTEFQYEANCPVTPSQYPPYAVPINCEINHSEFGHGLNDGRTHFRDDGIRSVYRITFPKFRKDNKFDGKIISRHLQDF